ncbi:glutathionylspermidine synthase family protein [Silvibacterium sp.]|uniref:glutathionylspermidine synthase family protein n=1 Tax=Silvibacterium sp. TaxID=1964179 RepID=UPI0039E6D2CF
MRRHSTLPRPGWQSKVESTGLTFHSFTSQKYWDESAYWEFTSAEVDRIEAATHELQRLCLAAGDHILEHNRFAEMRIPERAIPLIRETWQNEPPALYGRMDLAFDGRNLKLLEYNADTPTSLLEASVTQWYWLLDKFPDADQFNSIHEKLVAKWRDLKPYVADPLYFVHDPAEEDRITVTYLRDTAHQADIRTEALLMRDIGWKAKERTFVDLEDRPMRSIFKLYPWEWLLTDSFADHVFETAEPVQWIEPAWKMLWSNKALLAVLWELFPGHELLAPAYLDGPRELTSYARKPILGREGANISIVREGITMDATGGEYGAQGYVWQQYVDLAASGSTRAILGSWLIDGEAAGIGVRESDGLIVTNTSRFVPHLFRE